ncbi:3-isopropylmalate dehydratase small subunit [Streptomyces diacarni]|uniref:3-isopropylmalate dehydratase small subunit n=1 Tax=Streptomyces diacarni TaxID=2800381 RepID=A0A367ECE2_9ACTN|nr:3-isopropylmalate dehydratase small subunit [Streptomyces diacarni]RCG15701.1 3-isopropylmalate dehydratase small subunit [Streptomyces diacarni]
MEQFVTHSGIAVPLARTNVNTDDIIPARFLKSIRRSGFGKNLFANWRYLEDGRTPNPEFSLNRPGSEGASILVAGENFGCGSSREHAPWALREYGFRCVIAPSFADIFHNNCFNSSILPVALESSEVDTLFKILQDGGPTTFHIDLSRQIVTAGAGDVYHFEIDPFKKSALLEGLDNIGWSLKHLDEIHAYEQRRRQEAPWLFTEKSAN